MRLMVCSVLIFKTSLGSSNICKTITCSILVVINNKFLYLNLIIIGWIPLKSWKYN